MSVYGRETHKNTHAGRTRREVGRVSVRCKAASAAERPRAAWVISARVHAGPARRLAQPKASLPPPPPREPAPHLVRGLVGLVAHHLVVEFVADNELVRELHAVRLHRMRRAIVVLPDLGVVQVCDSVLDPRTRHGRRGGGRPSALTTP